MTTTRRASGPVVGFGRGRRTNTIAVVACSLSGQPTPSETQHISQVGPDERLDPFNRAFSNGVVYASQVTKFNIVWHYWRRPDGPEDVANRLASGLADAAVVVAPRDQHLPLLEAFAESEFPHVTVCARPELPGASWVASDQREAAAEATTSLLKAGHEKVAFLAGPQDICDNRQRQIGYREAMDRQGVPVEDWMIQIGGADVFREADAQPMRDFLTHRPRPTAVLCHSDEDIQVLLTTAWELGLKIPKDIAVIALDETDFATELSPPVTAVRQPIEYMASMAFYLAGCAAIGQQPRTGSWQVCVPATLVVRDSCGTGRAKSQDEGEKQALTREHHHRMQQLQAINAELRELLYVASHDLRSPLVTIEGFVDLILRKHVDSLDADIQKKFSRIQASADTMADLMETLLAVSRSHNQPLALETVSVAQIVESALNDLSATIRATNAEVTVASDLPTVVIDYTAFRRVYLNLIGNALKYMGDQPEPRIEIGYLEKPDEHVLYVRDNGIGISPEFQQRVFQLFWRVPDSPAEGSGLGLSAVKGIVLRHGGRVWIESELGEGATVKIGLPRRESVDGNDE
ncbi:MAG: substrate-binding domain-containing protein [Armatimonadetes bacterium]|nr:substrate-binding domain-containing protein [Armatimonadota bacterium]